MAGSLVSVLMDGNPAPAGAPAETRLWPPGRRTDDQERSVARSFALLYYTATFPPQHGLALMPGSHMPQIWSEPFDSLKHRDRMPEVEPSTEIQPGAASLLSRRVYFVRVCSFIFEFHSLRQIRACLDYYSQKIHPTSRVDIRDIDRWAQRWFERVPLFLREEPKRRRVVKALENALQKFTLEE
jgi:hypothetical protein